MSLSNEMIALVSLIAFFAGGSWTLAWFFSAKLSDIKSKLFDRIDLLQRTLTDQLQYHERHDDARFQALGNDIWAIRIRNAARDGDTLAPRVVYKNKEEEQD